MIFRLPSVGRSGLAVSFGLALLVTGCSKTVNEGGGRQASTQSTSGADSRNPVPLPPSPLPPVPGGDPFAQRCDQGRLGARDRVIKQFNALDLLARMDHTIHSLSAAQLGELRAAFSVLNAPTVSASDRKQAQTQVRALMGQAFSRQALPAVGDLFADIRSGRAGIDQTYQGVYVAGGIFAGVSRQLQRSNLDAFKLNWIPGNHWISLSIQTFKVASNWTLSDAAGAPRQDLPATGGSSFKLSQFIEDVTLAGQCRGRTEMTTAEQQDFDRLPLPTPL